MFRFPILFRVASSVVERSKADYMKRSVLASGIFKRSIQSMENNFLHRTLENLTGYERHVTPSPISCIYINRKISRPNIEKCNCTAVCRLFKKTLSPSVIPKRVNVINMKELFYNDNFSFHIKDINESSSTVVTENLLHIQNLASLLTQDLDVINNLKLQFQNLSNDELIQIMVHSSLLQFQNKINFSLLMKTLDSECCKRYLNWSPEQQLYVADILYHLHVGKSCYFNLCVINNLSKTLDDLTTCQLIHLLFIINLRRKINSELILKIEKILKIKLPSFTPEEVAIVALAYFKTSTKITSNTVISEMINHLNKSMLNMEGVVIASIFKILRYSFRFENENKIFELLNKSLEHRVWKTSFPVAVHLCLLASSHNIYVPNLLDAIITDLCKFDNVRLKDMSRVLLVASKFNHVSYSTHHHVFHFFQKEFENPIRIKEIELFPHPYMTSLLCLAYAGMFIYKELNKVFSKQFYKLLETRGHYDFLRDLAMLDYVTEIDAPDYMGNKLDATKRFEVFQERRHARNDEKKSFRKHISLDISMLLRDILNQDVSMIHLLPYMDDPVFLLIFNSDGQLSKPTDDFMKLVSAGHFARPTNEDNWVVIWPLTKTDLRSSKEGLSGFSRVKERHFIKLGYNLIKLPIDVHNNLQRSKTFLLDSLKCYFKNS